MKKNLNSININKEVFLIKKSLFKNFDKYSKLNDSKRYRLNLHKNDVSILHEMIIFFQKKSYVSIHFFLKKSTTYFIIKGKIKVNVYNKNKKLIKSIVLSSFNTKNNFAIYLKRKTIYNIDILTKNALVLELQDNLFDKNDYKEL